MPALTIDVVSDVVCPWCLIGKRRLERALALRPAIQTELRFHPFQLDATIPPQGVPRIDYLTRKFGSADKIAAIYARITEAGRDDGIAFAFERITVSPNTLDCHRVIRWAAEAGVQPAVKERLMTAFFLEGVDLSRHDELARLAGEAGMVAHEVASWLATDEDRDSVQAEVQRMFKIGVSGVPFFIFGGRLAVSGAQSPEVLAQAMDEAVAEMAKPS